MRFFVWVLGVCLIAFAATVAYGHHAESGWMYPGACCNKKDCRILHLDQVRVTQQGYFLPDFGKDGTLIPFSAANTSPDGEYHACIRHWDAMDFPEVRELSNVRPDNEDRMNRSPVCFWAPEGAV